MPPHSPTARRPETILLSSQSTFQPSPFVVNYISLNRAFSPRHMMLPFMSSIRRMQFTMLTGSPDNRKIDNMATYTAQSTPLQLGYSLIP
jgi:hypothetical protein